MYSPSSRRTDKVWRRQEHTRVYSFAFEETEEQKQRGKDARNASIRNKLQEKQQEVMLTFASPTTDHSYKKVFLCTSPEIRRDFCSAILKIMMPMVRLAEREVEIESEFVDGDAVSASQATGGPRPQNLKVDALFCVDVEDDRRDGLPSTRHGRLMSKPAWILAEMQVGQQHFGARLMSYVSKILAGLPINVEIDVIPSPVYAIAFCMWACDWLVKGPYVIRSDQLDVGVAKRFTETGYASVFLGRLIEIKNKNRSALDRDLAEGQSALKNKVVEFFRKENWESLGLEEKKVYLWLEFLSFAHLMTAEHQRDSLACLNGDPAVDIFDAAYGAVKLNFEGVTMDEIQQEYPDIYGYGEERLRNERIQKENERIQKEIVLERTKTNVLWSLAQAIAILTASEAASKLMELISSISPDFRKPIYKELVERGVSSEILEPLKQAVEDQAREEMAKIGGFLSEARDALRDSFPLLGQLDTSLEAFTEIMGRVSSALQSEEISRRDLRVLLENLEKVQHDVQLAWEKQSSSYETVLKILRQEPLFFYVQAFRNFSGKEVQALNDLDPQDLQDFNKKLEIWREDPKEGFNKLTEAVPEEGEEETEMYAWQKAALVNLEESGHKGTLLGILSELKRFNDHVKARQERFYALNKEASEILANTRQQFAAPSPKRSPSSEKRPVFSGFEPRSDCDPA